MRLKLVMALTAIIALMAGGIGTAEAGSSTQVRAVGTESFQPNVLIQATFRFDPGTLTVASGSDITFKDLTGVDGHTLSIVNKSSLPTSVNEVFNCAICNRILGEHFGGGTVKKKVDIDGDGGLSVQGDSILIEPGQSGTIPVTAPPGSVLHFLCSIHPWMQGEIKVT
jgi:plastocyanin